MTNEQESYTVHLYFNDKHVGSYTNTSSNFSGTRALSYQELEAKVNDLEKENNWLTFLLCVPAITVSIFIFIAWVKKLRLPSLL